MLDLDDEPDDEPDGDLLEPLEPLEPLRDGASAFAVFGAAPSSDPAPIDE